MKPPKNDNILNHQAIIAIEAENNRDPEFLDGPSFEFEGISKNFPTDVVLSLVYEDVFATAQVSQNSNHIRCAGSSLKQSFVAQDLDHRGEDAIDTLVFSVGKLEIIFSPNKIVQDRRFTNYSDAAEELVSVVPSDSSSTNDFCSGDLGGKDLQAFRVDFLFTRNPADVVVGTNEYTFNLVVEVRGEKRSACIVRESNPGRPRGRRAFYH